ncbi:glycosyltransferase [Maritimibacter dapengensis]|uniref:Glycosyltransferase n=1 Tax=Maritimibacter dapengensis TaxID=2836868 RepID=A0ABS6SYC5_9RHOB|nr:glycosyltransferase [Maritimibacter dapengensis]MBV7377974.1 glycosyltransferase [Maritimibacter dapengensis]
MRAALSIVIPTLNAESVLPACLASLMPGVEAGLVREVVIADGGSDDATQMIADEVGAIWVPGPAGRGGQLARGVAAAGGDWLLVLHADAVLGEDWVAAVQAGMAQGGPGYFRLRFRARGPGPRIVGVWANLRARLGLPFGDQGLLVSRADYEAAGGYRDIPLMEDMALARALARPRPLGAVIETGWTRYEGRWLRQGAGNIVRQIRFMLGADPARLARSYRD